MMNESASWLFSSRVWIVNHFGRKPNSGGNPPREKKFKISVIFRIGFRFNKISCFMKKILNEFRITIMFNEIIVYTVK